MKIQPNNNPSITYFPKYSKWIFTSLFLLLAFIYGYNEILFKPPQSTHMWRQCDCLSITTNYYENNNCFFEPSVHYLGDDGTGRTISEFPIIYYSLAKIWKIFGQHNFIYRLIILLFFFFGLFYLFKLIEKKLNDSILSIITTLFLFTSPTLVYFANNFLMDIPALSLAIIGLYYFMEFCETSSNKKLYLTACFYSLAGLLKVSSLISFGAILFLFGLELINVKILPNKKLFNSPLKQFLILFGVLLIQVIWYLYAANYNSKYNGGIFLIGILPIWEIPSLQISNVFEAIRNHIRWDYFRIETQVIFAVMFISIIIFYKHVEKLLLTLTLTVFVGVALFMLLFFQALKDHDYYTINLFVLTPLVLLTFLFLLKSKFPKIFYSIIFKILLLALLIHNADFARRRINDRYDKHSWYNQNYYQNMKVFETISPYLKSIGIKSTDRVISISDESINISLLLMGQKGWTNYGINNDTIAITQKIRLGAKYLLISKKDIRNQKNIQFYRHKKIGEFNNVEIYSLH